MREKAVFMQVHLFRPQRPTFEVAGGAKQRHLGAFQFEGYVLQGDEAFAGLGLGVIQVVEVGGGGVHAGADGFDIFLS